MSCLSVTCSQLTGSGAFTENQHACHRSEISTSGLIFILASFMYLGICRTVPGSKKSSRKLSQFYSSKMVLNFIDLSLERKKKQILSVNKSCGGWTVQGHRSVSSGIPFLGLLIIRPFVFKGKNNSSLMLLAVSSRYSWKQAVWCVYRKHEILDHSQTSSSTHCVPSTRETTWIRRRGSVHT